MKLDAETRAKVIAGAAPDKAHVQRLALEHLRDAEAEAENARKEVERERDAAVARAALLENVLVQAKHCAATCNVCRASIDLALSADA